MGKTCRAGVRVAKKRQTAWTSETVWTQLKEAQNRRSAVNPLHTRAPHQNEIQYYRVQPPPIRSEARSATDVLPSVGACTGIQST